MFSLCYDHKPRFLQRCLLGRSSKQETVTVTWLSLSNMTIKPQGLPTGHGQRTGAYLKNFRGQLLGAIRFTLFQFIHHLEQ